MNAMEAVEALKGLASEQRLKVVRFLVRAGNEGAPAGEVASALGIAPSKLSFHLSALEKAGLVQGRKSSRQVIYQVRFDAIGALVAYLLHDCCVSDTRVTSCC